METTASDYFATRTAEYDSLIRRAVPRYDEMIERMVEYLPEDPRRILELGSGTGNYTLALAERFPDAELTLVDGAGEMLELTRSRLRGAKNLKKAARGRVQTVQARFEDLDLEPGSYDLVTSCIAIHHVEDKATLFLRIRDAIEPGGRFVFADQMAGVDERHSAINWAAMDRFWRLPDHLTDAECRELEEHAERHDVYVPIVEHVRLLEQAGFEAVDVVWRNYLWGTVSALAR